MLGKCTKYWHECYEILAVGAILNPRLKFGAIRFAYTKIDLSTCEKMIIALRKKIEKLFDECVKVKSSESNASTSQQISPPPQQVSYMDDEQVIDALGENLSHHHLFYSVCFAPLIACTIALA